MFPLRRRQVDPDSFVAARTIDDRLAADLVVIGLHDLRELSAVGAIGAWDRLRRRDLRDDLSTLMALEAAVRRRRLVALEPEVREALAAHVLARASADRR